MKKTTYLLLYFKERHINQTGHRKFFIKYQLKAYVLMFRKTTTIKKLYIKEHEEMYIILSGRI